MEIPTNQANQETVSEGLPREEMDRLMNELLTATPIDEGKGGTTDQGWDKMALLTGGFVPVGSIFWARPPKLRSQQKIFLALDEIDAENSVVKRAEIILKLASSMFYVREGSDFRPATEDEIGGDELGMTTQEINEVILRLLNVTTEANSGNA